MNTYPESEDALNFAWRYGVSRRLMNELVRMKDPSYFEQTLSNLTDDFEMALRLELEKSGALAPRATGPVLGSSDSGEPDKTAKTEDDHTSQTR